MFVATMTCNGTIAKIATARRDVSTIYKKASALSAKARASSCGASVQVQVAAATVEGINRAGCIAGGIESEMWLFNLKGNAKDCIGCSSSSSSSSRSREH